MADQTSKPISLWDEIYSLLFLAGICAIGLWAIGLTGVGESRAFMACALVLLWLIFRKVTGLADSVARFAVALQRANQELPAIRSILGGVLASMPSEPAKPEPRSDWERLWASFKKPWRS